MCRQLGSRGHWVQIDSCQRSLLCVVGVMGRGGEGVGGGKRG